tara:strand:+ start:441 stop:1214 length:774 start_codon:yes stop_codon:yes gene_type:complete
MPDFTKIINISLDNLSKIQGISADSIEKVDGLTPDGGGDEEGIDQYGAMVVMQGVQNQSYLDQVIQSPQSDLTYEYEDDGTGASIFRIRADKFPNGNDDQVYALLTATLPSIASISNGTDLVIRFEVESKGAFYGFMAEDDLESFQYSDVERNSVLWLDQRSGNNKAQVYTTNRNLIGNSVKFLAVNAVRFSKDGSGNLTVKWQTYNTTHGYYVDRVTVSNNSTFNSNFDPNQPLRFYVYTHRVDANLMRNLVTLTE